MLSIVLATHNEEANLGRCLGSIQRLADEIVVVDGESTDQTVSIAKSLGAKVFSTTNKSNFHINKQLAMDTASGDLVLQLDADEVLDPELQAFIASVHQTVNSGQTPKKSAWYLKRKNYFLGRFLSKGGQYPDPVIRLYLKGKAYLPQKNVHEQMTVDGVVGTAEGHLLHYPYPNFSSYMRKFNTYTSFEAERLTGTHFRHEFSKALLYFVVKPATSFFSIFVRHKGFVDGMAGFIFALMSSLHHPFVYLKTLEMKERA